MHHDGSQRGSVGKSTYPTLSEDQRLVPRIDVWWITMGLELQFLRIQYLFDLRKHMNSQGIKYTETYTHTNK